MLLKIGSLAFKTNEVSYNKLSFAHKHKWEEIEKTDKSSPSMQYVGSSKTASITGTLLPTEYRGALNVVDILNLLSSSPQLVVTGFGRNLGYWVITQVDESLDRVFKNGLPRKVSYTISLKYFGEEV